MSQLPAGFAALEPFIAEWDLAGERARAQARSGATTASREAFYSAALPLMKPALDYLDARPLNALEEPEARLMRLMMSLANVALTVEVMGDSEPTHATLRARLELKDHFAY